MPRSCGPDLPALVRSHTSLDPDNFAALITAAELHGVPLPPWAEFRPDGGGPVTAVVEPVPWGKKSGPHFREPGRFLHLSRQSGASLPRRRGIAGHPLKIREGDLVEIDGLRLTSVARTWVDLGSVLPIDDLVVAGDAIVSEKHARHFGPPKVAMVPLLDDAGLPEFTPGCRVDDVLNRPVYQQHRHEPRRGFAGKAGACASRVGKGESFSR
ncbi:hypothetical protein [Arthrobacter sp. SAFR-014]|uniref:hypothetical protein n=1 Tax=unclassified Arthrobacter TaxID=235627 RepID=UPI003F7CD0E6